MYDIQTELILRRMDRQAEAASSARMSRQLEILVTVVVWGLRLLRLAGPGPDGPPEGLSCDRELAKLNPDGAAMPLA